MLNLILCLCYMHNGNEVALKASHYISERCSANTTAYTLWLFVGFVGVHRFYLDSPFVGLFEATFNVVGLSLLILIAPGYPHPNSYATIGALMLATGCIFVLSDLCRIPELIKAYYDTKYLCENEVYVSSSAASLARPLLTHPAVVNDNTYSGGRSDIRGLQYSTGSTGVYNPGYCSINNGGSHIQHFNSSSSSHHVAVPMPLPTAPVSTAGDRYSPFPIAPAAPSYDQEYESLKQFLDSINVPCEVFRKLVDSDITLSTLPLMSTGDFKDIGISVGQKLAIVHGLQQREASLVILNPEMAIP